MELRDFISTTLNEILHAIVLSQRFVSEHNIHAEVAPRDPIYNPQAMNLKEYTSDRRATITNVAFDVAVTASDEQSIKGGAGIRVVGFNLNLGADAAKVVTTSAVSRISFTVPVVLPDPEQVSVAKL